MADLRERLAKLSRTRDPVRRNELAVKLLNDFRRVLAEVRRQAARDAVASGMRPADYARAIGVTRGAVYHLLHSDDEEEER